MISSDTDYNIYLKMIKYSLSSYWRANNDMLFLIYIKELISLPCYLLHCNTDDKTLLSDRFSKK